MVMLDMHDSELQLKRCLQNIFGAEGSFRRWLDEMKQASLASAHDIGVLVLSDGITSDKLPAPTAKEVMDGLQEKGIDWIKSIRESLEDAESKWSSVAKSHEAVLARIKGILK